MKAEKEEVERILLDLRKLFESDQVAQDIRERDRTSRMAYFRPKLMTDKVDGKYVIMFEILLDERGKRNAEEKGN